MRRRQRSEDKRRARRRSYQRARNAALTGLSRQRRAERRASRGIVPIVAPQHFSFIDNTEGIVEFIESIRAGAAKQRNLLVDLRSVRILTADAIVVLLSEIAKITNVTIFGNAPADPVLANMFTQSGFYGYVQAPRVPRQKGQGRITRKKSKVVDSKIAKDLIQFATSTLYGSPRKLRGVYRVLIECMNNTIDHAARAADRPENWWATVYCENPLRRADFAFVDSGLGIFESVKVGRLLSIAKLFGMRDNADVLQAILKGEVASRTGEPYRGKGLPSVYGVMKRGGLSKLIVIANDVYANISKWEFRRLTTPFGGTFWYWEVQGDSENKT
jgi:hypothetical protein